MLANRYPRQHFGAALATLLAIPLAACFGQDKLYISSTTVLGLDASVNTARTAGHVQLGYDRHFVTWVPQTVSKEKGAREVMSALNCTEVVVSGLTLTKFDESLATGTAAILFAQKIAESQNSTPYFECFTDQQAGR
jgi:hypothetical protein